MAEQDSTTIPWEKSEWLSDLLCRPLWGLESFIKTLDDDSNGYENLLAVLIPLVEHLKSDLKVINEVLGESFGGPIRVEFADYPKTWRALTRENFKLAFIAPAPVKPQAAAPGGE